MTLNRTPQLLISVSLAAVFFLAGCASSTIINSEPQGAQVFVDGQSKGTTPFSYSDRKTIGSTTNILLKKEGYEDYNMLLVRNEEFDAAACAGGIFTLIPFLWIQKYSPERTLDLVALDGTDEIDTSPEATPTPIPTATPEPAADKNGVKVKVAPAKPAAKAPKAAKPAAKPKPSKAPKAKPEAKKPPEPKAEAAAKPDSAAKPADAPAAKPAETAPAPSEAPKQ
ncbi:MAG: PEGA domain-containing protein [Bdellovibrionia bacterium]